MIKEYQLQKKQNSFEVTLHYKGVKVRVAFTGGNVYKGTKPRFRTDNQFKMKAIEASELFKTKEVVVLRTIQEATPQPPAVVQRKRVAKVATPKAAQVTKPTPKPAPQPAPTPVVQEPEPVVQDPEPTPVDADGEGGENGEMKFGNVGEAIVYIAKTWGIAVKTEKEARDVLKEHGINPRISRG